jgi:hypothetical protein
MSAKAMSGPFAVLSATIANSGTTSDAVDLFKFRPIAIQFPASMTGTAMTFTGATENSDDTFLAIYDTGGSSAYSITIGSSRIVPINERVLWCARYLKLVSGSAESGAKTIKVICLPLSE